MQPDFIQYLVGSSLWMVGCWMPLVALMTWGKAYKEYQIYKRMGAHIYDTIFEGIFCIIIGIILVIGGYTYTQGYWDGHTFWYDWVTGFIIYVFKG